MKPGANKLDLILEYSDDLPDSDLLLKIAYENLSTNKQ